MDSRPRALVLGASGFIGRRVVAGLRASTWAPVGGVRRLPSSPAGDTEYRLVDAGNADAINAALEGIDAVVNCVAGDAAVISGGAKILAAAAALRGSQLRIIHLSSMAVYGDASGLVDESAPLRPNLGPYSEAKVAAERHLESYPNLIVLRPGCVWGPESTQWSTRFAEWLCERRMGDLGAQGDGYCNLVHVEDVVEAIRRALGTPLGSRGIFNLSIPNPPTWNEYLIRYAQALGAVPVKRISHRRLAIESKLLAPPLKIAEILQRAARFPRMRLPAPIPPSLLRLMSQEIRLDVRHVEQQLGLQWKDLDAGLQETARWYLSNTRS